MRFWKEIDKNANEREVKAIVSDNVLNHPDVCVFEHPGDLLNTFQKILPTSGICFKDNNEKTKLFYVVIDDIHIGTPVDEVSFVTGKDDEYEVATTTISGSKETKIDSSDILFEKGLKDTVYIDIETIEDNIVLHINTCNVPNELCK